MTGLLVWLAACGPPPQPPPSQCVSGCATTATLPSDATPSQPTPDGVPSRDIDNAARTVIVGSEAALAVGLDLQRGDLTGDGVPDLLVGGFAASWVVDGATDAATIELAPDDAVVAAGASHATLGRFSDDGAAVAWVDGPGITVAAYAAGETVDHRDLALPPARGARVAAGDLTGDGLAELIATVEPDDLTAPQGVHLWHGPIDADRADPDVVLVAEDSSRPFDGIVAVVPDLDGDGIGDLLLTAAQAGVGQPAYILPGPVSGDRPLADAEYRWFAVPPDRWHAAGDLDHDGYQDLLGRHHEELLVDYDPLNLLEDPTDGEAWSDRRYLPVTAIAGLGDVSGDDIPDVAVAHGDTVRVFAGPLQGEVAPEEAMLQLVLPDDTPAATLLSDGGTGLVAGFTDGTDPHARDAPEEAGIVLMVDDL